MDISGPLTAERIVKEMKRHKEKGKVLDIGSGRGENVKVFRSYDYETFGLDIRNAFDSSARGLSTRATVMRMPFGESAFDVVTESLMYSQAFEIDKWLDAEYRTSLREIKRVLAPSGILISSWAQGSGLIRATGMSKVHRHALEVGLRPLPSKDRSILVFERPLE